MQAKVAAHDDEQVEVTVSRAELGKGVPRKIKSITLFFDDQGRWTHVSRANPMVRRKKGSPALIAPPIVVTKALSLAGEHAEVFTRATREKRLAKVRRAEARRIAAETA